MEVDPSSEMEEERWSSGDVGCLLKEVVLNANGCDLPLVLHDVENDGVDVAKEEEEWVDLTTARGGTNACTVFDCCFMSVLRPRMASTITIDDDTMILG